MAVFAIALELPEETFVEMHKYEEEDDSWFRCEWVTLQTNSKLKPDMAYYDEHKPEDEAKVGGVWLKGHQDHGGESERRYEGLQADSSRDDGVVRV